MGVRTRTDQNYINKLNRVRFGSVQWLKLQLKYKTVFQVHMEFVKYFNSTGPEDLYYSNHPRTLTYLDMSTLPEKVIERYGDDPTCDFYTNKCRELIAMRAIIPVNIAPKSEYFYE